jgi:hypothetical protein
MGLLDTPEIENETDFESMSQSEIKGTVNSTSFFFLILLSLFFG